MSRRGIKDSRAIVTGASSGIGRALAAELARRGAKVVVNARRAERLEELKHELEGQERIAAGSIEIVAGDITVDDTRKELIERARQAFGGFDILVNNAGIGAFGRFDEASAERLTQIMDVNFFAVAELTRLALPVLKEGRRPIVVNIGSILGHRGLPRTSEYCASKFALRGWTEALRVELSPQNIDVLLVSAGTTETEFYDRVIEGRGGAPWDRRFGVTAEMVAKKTVRAIGKGKREIFTNMPGRLLIWFSKWLPGVVDRGMRKYA